MTTYFTSDLHLGHARICELAGRPYSSVDEMNDALINNWNAVVRPEDTVMVLGDMVMGKKSETVPLISQLNGLIMLFPGNHDPMHPIYDKRESKRAEWVLKYHQAGIGAFCADSILTDLFPKPVMLSHFPYSGDHTDEERFTEYRPVDNGLILLHGHVHEAWQIKDRMINVGADVWDYTPVSEHRIRTIIEEM